MAKSQVSRDKKTEPQAQPEQKVAQGERVERKPASQPAEEWGERREVGRVIARGGKTGD